MLEFIQAIADDGFEHPPVDVPAGCWVRFPAKGKRKKNRSAACYLFPDMKGGLWIDYAAGDGIKYWFADGHRSVSGLSDEEKERIERRKSEIEEEKQRIRQNSLRSAEIFLSKCQVCAEHPYLDRKLINPVSGMLVYQYAGHDYPTLIIPMRKPNGKLSGYQRIYADGVKKYSYGCDPDHACFFIRGTRQTGSDGKRYRLICEGVATGVSLWMASGFDTVCAMSSGNLYKTARLMFERGAGDAVNLICADNDKGTYKKEGTNPGIETAEKIKKELGYNYVFPEFTDNQYSDFNDLHCQRGLDAVRQVIAEITDRPELEVLTKEDIGTDDDISLKIAPEFFDESTGLINVGMKAASDLTGISIAQFSLPVVISMIATAVASKIHCQNSYPSTFFIKVGNTQTGKSTTNKALKMFLTPYFRFMADGAVKNHFFGATDFSSGPGLLRHVMKHPRQMIILDEVTYMFTGGNGAVKGMNSISTDKAAALLELATIAGDRIEKPYSNQQDWIIIENACLNMIGNATKGIFSNLTLDDFESGLIQRFDFWMYDGEALKRDDTFESSRIMAEKFANGLTDLFHCPKPEGEFDILSDSSIDTGVDRKVQAVLKDYSDSVIDGINECQAGDGIKGIIAKKYDSALRFALIHSAASRYSSPVDIFSPLEVKNIEYGIGMAEMLAKWKIETLTESVHAGESDMQAKWILAGALACVRNGLKPTYKTICNRSRRLKNLKIKEFDELAGILEYRDEIVIENSGRKKLYIPVKARE